MKKILLSFSTIVIAMSLFAQPAIEWKKTYGGNNDDECYSINNTSDGGYILAGVSNSTDTISPFGSYDIWIIKTNSSGDVEWHQNFGGSSDEEAHSIQQTQDGNYIFLGVTSSTDNAVTNNKGGADCWLVKITSLGNIDFQKTYGGSSNDCYVDWSADPDGYKFNKNTVIETSDNGYLIAGSTSSSDGDVAGAGYHANKDFWIVKTDASGNIGASGWKKALGGNDDEEAVGVIQTSGGGYLIVGYTESANNGDVGVNNSNPGNSDAWVVKLNADGSFGNFGTSGKKCFGGANNDGFRSVVEATDGGYVYAGYARSSNGDLSGTGNSGQDDSWIFKTDSLGVKIWSVQIGGPDFERAMSIDKTNDGGYIVNGYTNSTTGDISGNQGGFDYWVVKLNKDGVVEWQKAMGGSVDDDGYSVKTASDGGYIVAGKAKSNDKDVIGNHSSSTAYTDIWVAKFEAPAITCNLSISPSKINLTSGSGTATINVTAVTSWTATPGGNCSWLSINPTSGTGNGTITVTYPANTTSTERTCNITILCDSETKTDTIVQDGLVAIHEINNSSFNTLVSPNPVKDKVTFTLEKTGQYEILISDILGKEVLKNEIKNQSLSINISHLNNGIYVYTIFNQNGQKSVGKLAVVH